MSAYKKLIDYTVTQFNTYNYATPYYGFSNADGSGTGYGSGNTYGDGKIGGSSWLQNAEEGVGEGEKT